MTLLELCVVAAIVAILLVVAIPPFFRAQEAYRLSAAADEVRSELHRARILSIVRDEDCRLRVTSPSSYLIECQTPEWVEIRSRRMPRDFVVSANNEPEFHPLGNVGPMATVRVWNPAGDHRRIIISRSGRIRIE